jgi:hypothetical protein
MATVEAPLADLVKKGPEKACVARRRQLKISTLLIDKAIMV